MDFNGESVCTGKCSERVGATAASTFLWASTGCRLLANSIQVNLSHALFNNWSVAKSAASGERHDASSCLKHASTNAPGTQLADFADEKNITEHNAGLFLHFTSPEVCWSGGGVIIVTVFIIITFVVLHIIFTTVSICRGLWTDTNQHLL
jgi:hypothetical protein